MSKPIHRSSGQQTAATHGLEETQPYFTLEDTAMEIARGLKPLGAKATKYPSGNPYDSVVDAGGDPLNRRVDPARMLGTNDPRRRKPKDPR